MKKIISLIINKKKKYVLLVASYLLVLLKSDSVIARKYPKILILTYGFCFARLMTMLQLSHLMSAP